MHSGQCLAIPSFPHHFPPAASFASFGRLSFPMLSGHCATLLFLALPFESLHSCRSDAVHRVSRLGIPCRSVAFRSGRFLPIRRASLRCPRFLFRQSAPIRFDVLPFYPARPLPFHRLQSGGLLFDPFRAFQRSSFDFATSHRSPDNPFRCVALHSGSVSSCPSISLRSFSFRVDSVPFLPATTRP